MSIIELFKANFKILYRDSGGFFWTLVMPVFIYVALSALPIGKFINTGSDYSNYLLPGIIALVIMQGGVYSVAYWLVDVKARGVIKRFLVTPIKTSELLLSLVASRIVVVFLQVALLSLIGFVFFGATLPINIFYLFIFIILGGALFVLLGLIISTFADTYQTAAPITAAIGLPLTFLGNIFFPIQNLPHSLYLVAKWLPMTYMADGFRSLYLYRASFAEVSLNIFMLFVWLIVISVIALWRFKLEE